MSVKTAGTAKNNRKRRRRTNSPYEAALDYILSLSKDQLKAFWIDAGIDTPDGKLTERYKKKRVSGPRPRAALMGQE
jgi:hypothetical protein